MYIKISIKSFIFKYVVLLLLLSNVITAYSVLKKEGSLCIEMEKLTLKEAVDDTILSKNNEDSSQPFLEVPAEEEIKKERRWKFYGVIIDKQDYNKRTKEKIEKKDNSKVMSWISENKSKTACILGIPIATIVTVVTCASVLANNLIPPEIIHAKHLPSLKDTTEKDQTSFRETTEKDQTSFRETTEKDQTSFRETTEKDQTPFKETAEEYEAIFKEISEKYLSTPRAVSEKHLEVPVISSRIKQCTVPQDTSETQTTTISSSETYATNDISNGTLTEGYSTVRMDVSQDIDSLLVKENQTYKSIDIPNKITDISSPYLYTLHQGFHDSIAEKWSDSLFKYSEGNIFVQKGLIFSEIKSLKNLNASVREKIKNHKQPYSFNYEFFLEIEEDIDEEIKKNTKLFNQIDSRDERCSDEELFGIKLNIRLLEESVATLIEQEDFDESKVWDKWTGLEYKNHVDLNIPGDPIAGELVCNPFEFMKDNIVLLSDNLRNKKSSQYSNNLKLVRGDDNTYLVVEEASKDHDHVNLFHGAWLSRLSDYGDDVIKYIDIPKKPETGMILFTEVLSIGSIYITDFDAKSYRVYLDARPGNKEYENVVNKVNAPDYKNISSDLTVANVVIIYYEGEWKTILRKHEPPGQEDNNNANEGKTYIGETRKKRSFKNAVATVPAWVKWKKEDVLQRSQGVNAVLQSDVNKKLKSEMPRSGNFYTRFIRRNPRAGLEQISIHVRKLTNNAISYVDRPGRVVLFTYGKNYHSALMVYDSRQKGPVYLSVGDSEFRGRMNNVKHPLTPEVTKSSLLRSTYQYGLKSKNILKLDGLDTNRMISVWEEEVQGLKFHKTKQNCAKATSSLLVEGVSPYKRKDKNTGLYQDKFRNTKKFMMPKNVDDLGKEINELVGQNKRIKKRVLERLKKLNDKIERSKEFIGPYRKTQKTLRSENPGGLNKNQKGFLRRKLDGFLFGSKKREYPKTIPRPRDYFKSIQRNIKTPKFLSVVKDRSNKRNMGTLGLREVKFMAFGAMLAVTAQEVASFFIEFKEYNNRRAIDKIIMGEYMTVRGATAFIPFIGTFVKAGLSRKGGVDSLSQENAKDRSNEFFKSIYTDLNQGRDLFLPSIIRDEIASLMKLPILHYHKLYSENGRTFGLHAFPVKRADGYIEDFVLFEPLAILDRRIYLCFIVTENVKVYSSEHIKVLYMAMNGELLKRNIDVFEKVIYTLETIYEGINYLAAKWITPIKDYDTLKKKYTKLYWTEKSYVMNAEFNNVNYNPAKGEEIIKTEITEATKARDDYIKGKRNEFKLEELEIDFFSYYNKLMYDSSSLINIKYNPPDRSHPRYLTYHNRAAIRMIFDALNQLDSMFFPSRCGRERSLFKRYDSVDFVEKIILSQKFKEHKDHLAAIEEYKDEINIQMKKYNDANENHCSNDLTINFDNLQPVDTDTIPTNVFDRPYGIVRIKKTLDEFISWTISWTISDSNYFDMLTASMNDMKLGAFLHTNKDILPEQVFYEPIILLSFKAIDNQTASIETMQPYLGYKSAEDDIRRRTSDYDIQRHKIEDPVDFTIFSDDAVENIKYSYGLFTPEIMEPQPDVFQHDVIRTRHIIKSLNYTGLYTVTTSNNTYEFILCDKQSYEVKKYETYEAFIENRQCDIPLSRKTGLLEEIYKTMGEFKFIKYAYDDHSKEFIPYKIQWFTHESLDFHGCAGYEDRLTKFCDLLPNPTKEQEIALMILLDLPLKEMDFIEEIKKLSSKMENISPDIITSTQAISSSQLSSVMETFTTDENIIAITTESPTEISSMDQDVSEVTTAESSTIDKNNQETTIAEPSTKIPFIDQEITEVTTAKSSTKVTFMDEDMPEVITVESPSKETDGDWKQSNNSGENEIPNDEQDKTRNQNNKSSQQRISGNYVIGGAFVAVAASNFTNYDESTFDDLKEIPVENIDDESNWLQFSEISPISTFYSFDDVIRKRKLIVNWHLHRMACLIDVDNSVKNMTRKVTSHHEISTNQEWRGFFTSERMKIDFSSDMSSMGYTLAPRKEIEIIIDDINKLPDYVQDEVMSCSIRDVLSSLVPNLKIVDFIKRRLPQLSEFKVTEKGSNYADDRSFIVGNSPWFSVMHRLHSIEWCEENIWEKESSRLLCDSGRNRFGLSKLVHYFFGGTDFNKNHKDKFPSMIHVFDRIIFNNDNMKILDICKPSDAVEQILIELDVLLELNSYLNSVIIVPKTTLSQKHNFQETLTPVDSEVFLKPLTDEGFPKSSCDCKITSKEKIFN